MLKKQNRLGKTAEIEKVFGRGRTFFNPYFTLKFLSGPQRRFTVVVSTKVFKSAVKRNRLKRLAREFVRKNLEEFKSGSYVIIAKPKVSTLPSKDLLSSLADVCARIK